MMGLKGRSDQFKLIIPKTFILPNVEKKYSEILAKKHSFYTAPIDFLNESIQKVQIFGFTNATIEQKQSYRGTPLLKYDRINQNKMMFPSNDYNYRSPDAAISLIDKTLNIEFRQSLGYLNYFLLFENFLYQYSRDVKTTDLERAFVMEIYNENGVKQTKILLSDPIISGMDMLDLDYSQPIASSQTFKVEFKYSNIDIEFVDETENNELNNFIE